MALKNLNSYHLSAEKITAAQEALDQLESALTEINVTITPEDRKRYGSINEQNKLFVNKVYNSGKSQTALCSPDVDWAEFERDYNSRNLMESFIARLDNLSTRLKNAKTLYDYDNYRAALTDYSYATYKAGSGAPGFEDKYTALKQFFAKTPKGGDGDMDTPPQG